jgi:DNA-binding phage protein
VLVNAVDPEAKLVREWLLEVMRRTGMKATPLAKKVGLAPSTLLRALDEDNPSALERRSIKKIVDHFGVPAPQFADAQSGPHHGFEEPDLVLPDASPQLFCGVLLEPNQYVKIVNTRAAELVGYLPGDSVLFDMSVSPRAGDIVEAQVYGVRDAETIFRYFDPPYLVVRTADPSANHKPQLVDGERIKIVAVALRSMRERV